VAEGQDSGRSDLRRKDSTQSKNSPAPVNGLKTGDASKNNCGSDPHGTLEGRQPIKRENHDCDCCRDPYRRGEGACGEPTKAFKSRRPLRIHYDRGLNNAERYAAFLRHAYDENEAVQGKGYAVSGDSFDPSESSSPGADRDRGQQELNDYAESMPSKPVDYMSDEDTSSDSGNGFENLCRD
jgi:hypothetical protein